MQTNDSSLIKWKPVHTHGYFVVQIVLGLTRKIKRRKTNQQGIASVAFYGKEMSVESWS